MKIGFLININCAISGNANGVLKQAKMWAKGLRDLGHEVEFIGPAQDGSIRQLRDYDIVHFFQYGHWLKGFKMGPNEKQKWFFSPILDSTASVRLYGMLAKLPLDNYLLTFGPRLLRDFSMLSSVSVRSCYERKYMEAIAPSAQIFDNPISVTLVDGDSSKPRQELPEDFALFIGNVSAERKNTIRLIEACNSLGLPLVLGGLIVPSDIMKLIEAMIAKSRIKVYLLGFLKEDELRWLYQNCNVFCLPSLVEGVGQVAMEALYFGAPIVITSVGGPPDYFGNFAEYVDPYSIDDIAIGIDQAMKRKVDLMEARRFLNRFSVENTAQGLAKAYSRN